MSTHLTSGDEFYFQWHITERCNKSCSHCYQSVEHSPELSLPDLLLVLNRMEEALVKWGRTGTLSFTGGEPFIRQAELLSLVQKVDSMPSFAFYDILTNGSMISEDLARTLGAQGKLRRVQVSLEGSTPEMNDCIRGPGSFVETINAIRTMKRHGLTVSVMSTVSRVNYQDIPALIRLLDEEGVDTVAFERLVPEGRGQQLGDQLLAPQELRDLYDQIYRMRAHMANAELLTYRPLWTLVAPSDPEVGAICSAGNNALTVMPDGTACACRRLPIPIGNILEDGLFSIWYGSEVLWKIRDPDTLGGKCRECDLLASCRGCRAMAYACSGDYMAEDPQCWR